MDSLLGGLGTVSLAVALTALLVLGTKGGGKVKSLGWGVTLFLAMLAGAAYKAAGSPFDLVSNFVMDLVGLFGEVMPGYTLAGIALTLFIFILYKEMTKRQVAVIGIIFWYVASGADGGWGVVADKIQTIMQSIAS